MRILVHGLQSSGASLFTFFLGQLPNSVTVVDTYIHALTPLLDDVDSGAEHTIAKAVITTKYSLDDHIRSFRPDIKILVIRHPAHNYVSLTRKSYGHLGGPIDEKFRRMEAAYENRERYDCVISYESFVSTPAPTITQLQAVGIPVEKSFYDLPRSHQSIVDFNRRFSPWCDAQLGKKWGLGNIKKYQISPSYAFKRVPDSVHSHVVDLCPHTTAFAEVQVEAHFSPEYIFFSSVVNDVLKRKAVAGLRRLKNLVRH